MLCGHHAPDDEAESTRPSFRRSTVAVGDAAARAPWADLDLDLDGQSTETATGPRGPDDLSTRSDRQHAWEAFRPRGRFGNTRPPQPCG